MPTTFDADLELLGAAARRHLATLDMHTSVHISAAVDALTDPLVPPRLAGVDPAATADLPGVLRAVRARLLHAAQHAGDVQQTLAFGFAARELTHALAGLTPDPAGPTTDGPLVAPRRQDDDNPGPAGHLDRPDR